MDGRFFTIIIFMIKIVNFPPDWPYLSSYLYVQVLIGRPCTIAETSMVLMQVIIPLGFSLYNCNV